MINYTPAANFDRTYKEHRGTAIWEFLNLPENVARMETAIRCHRPAVEGVAVHLAARFPEEFLPGTPWANVLRQMVGTMVKEIVEHDGARLVRLGGKVQYDESKTFTRGALYRFGEARSQSHLRALLEAAIETAARPVTEFDEDTLDTVVASVREDHNIRTTRANGELVVLAYRMRSEPDAKFAISKHTDAYALANFLARWLCIWERDCVEAAASAARDP